MCFVLSAFPDYSLEVDQLIAEDGSVTVLSNYRATHLSTFMGVDPTGTAVSGSRADVFSIREGRIVESWHDWHIPSLLHQIGAQSAGAATEV
jgi:predicted ester cyclase